MTTSANTQQKVDVGVNIMEKSVTYISNTVFQLLFRIVHRRELDPTYITKTRKVIEDGLFTWLTEQSLKSLHVEVSLPGSKEALERWDFEFNYLADPDTNVVRAPVQEIEKACAALRQLPSGAAYEIVAVTEPHRTPVQGWEPYEFLPLNVIEDLPMGGWGYGKIGAKLFYRGGKWD